MSHGAGTAALLLLLGLIAGCGGGDGSADRSSDSSSPVTSISSGGAGAGERCDFPRVRPAHLPWIEAGHPLPAPSRERFDDYAKLTWRAGDSSLQLWRVDELLGGPGEPAPRLPNGAEGYLYESESDEDVANWAIVWADPQADGCNQTTLALHSRSLSKRNGKEEILRIAGSLTEEP